MSKITSDELPDRAFRLAYFLHRDRATAIEIAARALNKLRLAATAQGKRLYYRLTGRADARKARSKVSLGEPHLLQRLVYVESEEYEHRKELAAQESHADPGGTPARPSDLVVYFIKHLVRITTKRNSFYVTLGVSRLLYNYTTPETMDFYNLVIQDPDRVHDDYYYRSRKAVLLKELKERFGSLIEIAKGARGEQRWQASKETSRHTTLVRECLQWFTPWATPCTVPERFDPLSDTIEQLNFDGRHPDEEHEVEVNRIHAALHPECFARLAAANHLAAPDERLELPHFFLADETDDSDESSRTPPHLSADELQTINDLLAQEASRRKAASAGFLRVVVDGHQVAEIGVAHSAVARFEVDEAAEVVEVYSEDQKGAVLLATHLLNLNGSDTQSSSITTEGGQKITFTVNLSRDAGGSATGARVGVAFQETSTARAASIAIQRAWATIIGAAGDFVPGPSAWWKPAAAFGVLVLLIAGGWWILSNRENPNQVVKVTPTPAPTIAPAPATSSPSPQDERQTPVKRPSRIGNETTPTPLMARREPTRGLPDETFVERSLTPNSSLGTDPGEAGTRGAWERNGTGKHLGEIQSVHVQAGADNSVTQELLNELRARLAKGGTVKLSVAEQADAALEISVRQSSGDARVTASVQAINSSGQVVWPTSRRGSSWRYRGGMRYVADRIVSDLTRDIERAKLR